MSAKHPGRDYRIDFWRGLALLTIFVNHIPGNLFGSFTSRNFGFSDAAELFVFLAGFTAALAYFRRFVDGEALITTAKVWTRAAKIYMAHIVTAIGAIALFSTAAIVTGDGEYLTWHGLESLMADPVRALVGLAGLTFQIGYFNILPMYIVFLALLPGLMWLARRDLPLSLLVSGTVWFVAHATGLTFANWPGNGGWFFNPFGWQFLFTIGLACGIVTLRPEGGVGYNRTLYRFALGYVLLALIWRISGFSIANYDLPSPQILIDFGKADLALPRLLHVLALVYVVAHSRLSAWLRGFLSADNPIVLIGRHSLVVFCFGSLLAAFGQILRHAGHGALALDLIIVPTGVALHVVLASLLEWYRVCTTKKIEAGARQPDGGVAFAPAGRARPSPLF